MAEHIAQGRDAVLDAMARRRDGRADRRMTVDTEHRRLCHALFDALEAGDVAGVDACYAPGHDDVDQRHAARPSRARRTSRPSTRAAGMHRRRLYNDRNINTFDDGFVVQYTTHVVAHNGTEVPLSACLVAEVRDGKISKLFEYLDTTQFRSRAQDEMSDVMTEYEIRELCNEFFDAYQDGRVDVLRRIMSDDCIVWHNVFGRETTARREPRGLSRTATPGSAAAPTTTASSTRSTTAS